MSRIYEALKQSEKDGGQTGVLVALKQSETDAGQTGVLVATNAADVVHEASDGWTDLDRVPEFHLNGFKGKLVTLGSDGSLGADKFQVLATRLSHLRERQELKVLHLTSGVMGEGKSLIAANLAVALASRSKTRILLIDGDLRKPNVERMFGVDNGRGLGAWIEEDAPSILPFLRRISGLSLWLLPAGSSPDPTTVLQSDRIRELLAQVALWFDWVVIDSPPLLPMADANLWASVADGTLLVVRESKTPKRALEKGLESLDNPKIVGIVLNDVVEVGGASYYSRYYNNRQQPTGQ
jgi:capsular exopolysaccharide synthesis family protein